MSAAKRASNAGATVGVVSADRALSSRIRRILEAAGFTIVSAAAPDEIEGGGASRLATLVVTGPLRFDDSHPLSRARRRFPDARIVACTPPEDGRALRSAVDAGVDGVVWESRLDKTLEITLRAVEAGQVVVPQDSLARNPVPKLTNREKQTLSLVIMGLTNREIAKKLFVSESTVKSHLNTAYHKLGVHSRAEAARLIADPAAGLGTGILAITGPGLARGRARKE